MKPAWILALIVTLTAAPAAAQQTQVTGDELDQQVLAVFRNRCVVCHDNRRGDAAGDVSDLLDLAAISATDRGYINREQPQNSYLRELISTGAMPKAAWKDVRSNGPLTAEEKKQVLAWIDRGGPSPKWLAEQEQVKQAGLRQDISEPELVSRIATDLQKLSGTPLQNARYLAITNLHNMDSISAEQLQLYREALVKALNSLSRSSDVLGLENAPAPSKVVPIDSERTIYRFDLRQIGWKPEDWERLVKHNPYGIIHRNGAGKVIEKLTTSEVPWLRADWFCFAALQPPLYHDFVNIPKQLQDLEQRLGLNRIDNISQRTVARAGFARSGVSVNNRLLERHAFPGGYYHISYDFGRNDGTANFFENPFGPAGSLGRTLQFIHDGGEVIYRMANGFQAYALVRADGGRLSIAPSAIVHDNSMPGGAIINGISCLSCHYDGMKPENPAAAAKLDEVRDIALNNPRQFNADDRELITELFPPQAEFGKLLENDRQSFRRALDAAGIRRGPEEPCRALFDQFARNLDLEAVAGDFGLTTEALTELLNREGEIRQLAVRLKTGGVPRQLYVIEFRRIVTLAGIGDPRDFEELPLPYFGNDPEKALAAQAAPATSTPQEQQPGTDENANSENPLADPPRLSLLDDDNVPGNFKVTVSSGDGRDHFTEGEIIPCVIKASEDCFITVLGIDKFDNIQVLAPNKWHPQLKIEAGESLRLPTPEMGFEFFAEAPHGTTQIRVIATRKPLKIKGLQPRELQQENEGFKSLGNRRGIGVREETKPTPPTNLTPDNSPPLAPADIDLKKLFAPNDWATSRWRFTTHAPRN